MTYNHSGFERMFFFSAFLHLLFIGLILFSSPSFRLKISPSFYRVRLVSFPSSGPEGPGSEKIARKEGGPTQKEKKAMNITANLPKGMPKMRPRPQEKKGVSLVEIDKERQAQRMKTEAKNRDLIYKTRIDQAIARIRKELGAKESSNAKEVERETTIFALPPKKNNGLETSASGKGEEILSTYFTKIWDKIGEAWTLPQGYTKKQGPESIVSLVIYRDGSIGDIYLEKPSGDRYFDESGIRAIKKASPFPPLPQSYHGDKIEIGIRFFPQGKS